MHHATAPGWQAIGDDLRQATVEFLAARGVDLDWGPFRLGYPDPRVLRAIEEAYPGSAKAIFEASREIGRRRREAETRKVNRRIALAWFKTVAVIVVAYAVARVGLYLALVRHVPGGIMLAVGSALALLGWSGQFRVRMPVVRPRF